VVVPLVCALAAVALLVVAIENVAPSGKTELMGGYYPISQAQLFDLDPDELGASIYSTGAERARENLERSMEEQRAERRAIQQKQLEDAIVAEMEHAKRMQDACAMNPGIPGCPYKEKNIIWNHVGVNPKSVGPEYYSKVSENARGQLSRDRQDERDAVRDYNFEVEVQRYQNELANAMRMSVACQENPALPGCPAEGGAYVIDVDPPQYMYEPEQSGEVYSHMSAERRAALEDDKAEAKADVAFRNQKIADNMAAAIEAAEERLERYRKGCADGTGTGCY